MGDHIDLETEHPQEVGTKISKIEITVANSVTTNAA